jgi:lipoate-protein ligase A
MKGECGKQTGEDDSLNFMGPSADLRSLRVPSSDPALHFPLSSLAVAPSAIRLLMDPPAAGPWNMAVDEALLEAADHGQCTLRFYQWDQPALSFGYFQSYEDRRRHEASRSCAAVRRASGGGAILHDREVTYSLAVPARHPLAADRLGLYRAVHVALIEALTDWGIHAALCSPPPRASLAKEPFLCFQRRAAGDVLLSEAKIAGSAQRRRRGAVLQHGSVLLGRSVAAPELPGISDLTGRAIAPRELVEGWLGRLLEPWLGGRQNETLSDQERNRAAELVDIKYGAPAWTQSRGRV